MPRKTVLAMTRNVPTTSTMSLRVCDRSHVHHNEGLINHTMGDIVSGLAVWFGLPAINNLSVIRSITVSCKRITMSAPSSPKTSSNCSTLVKLINCIEVGITGGSMLLQCFWRLATMPLKVASLTSILPLVAQSRHISGVIGVCAQSPVSSGSNSAIMDCNLARWVFRSSSIKPRSSWANARCIWETTAFDSLFNSSPELDLLFANFLELSSLPSANDTAFCFRTSSSSCFKRSFSCWRSLKAAAMTWREPPMSTTDAGIAGVGISL
mmetsp:Transcript_106004/g.304809  ORF Transcript_106004/g.304809 Transcript_106004/m.304809 type:complete len:267 (+) Transcript_106004:1236-2036(+)